MIANKVPAIIYDAGAVHTSLGSYCGDFGFVADPDKAGHKEILDAMSAATEAVVREFSKECSIDYTKYLYTFRVAIAAGIPNDGFVELIHAVASACQERGINLKPAWGAHITLSRFKAAKPAEELGDFFKLFQNTPLLGKSRPIAVRVGYANWSQPDEEQELCGHFTTYERFPL